MPSLNLNNLCRKTYNEVYTHIRRFIHPSIKVIFHESYASVLGKTVRDAVSFIDTSVETEYGASVIHSKMA